MHQGLAYFWELSSSGRCSRYGSGIGRSPQVGASWLLAPQPSEHPSSLPSTNMSARCQRWEHSRGPRGINPTHFQPHRAAFPSLALLVAPGPPSPVTGSEGLWWERPLCQPWCRDPERRADGHVGSCWHEANMAAVTLQRHPSGAGSPQHSWPRSLPQEQRDCRGQWLPLPRGPAPLTEVTSAVSVVPAWAVLVVVVSLLPGVPPSTCQGKGNQVSLEVPPGSG